MRKRKWKTPNVPTPQARQIWKAIYQEPWPVGWRVRWVGFMRGAMGLTKYVSKEILLSFGDAKRRRSRTVYEGWITESLCKANMVRDDNPAYAARLERYAQRTAHYLQKMEHAEDGCIHTLIHEFVHVRNKGLKHGKEFDRLVQWGWDRLMEAKL